MKKILLLHTGGTFGMVTLEPDEVLTPGNLLEELVSHVPELNQIADIDVEIPFNEDSANVGIAHWDQLAKTINSKMNDYDGFVVIHGTDTMVYSASAMSFSLLNLKKPVIFTGAQRPLAKLRSDARLNIIDAVEVSTFDLNEVLIVFGQSILRANRSRKTSRTSYDAFYTPNYPAIGVIGQKVDIYHNLTLHSQEKYRFHSGFNSSMISIHIFPGCDPSLYNDALHNPDIYAILLIGFGIGNIPIKEKNWLLFIEKAKQAGKAVFINSSTAHGSIDLQVYEIGKKAMLAGAIGCKDMTLEASIVKIMKALSLTKNVTELIEFFLNPIAGEIES
jgi:L-asparaginase